MLNDPQKLALQDFSGEHDYITLDTNWNKESKGNKYLKFQVGDEEAIVSMKQLRSIIWLLSDPEERDGLAAARLKILRSTRRKIVARANKHISPGEDIVFWIDIPVEKDFVGHLR